MITRTAVAGGSYLGVGVAELTQDRVKALNLKEERGVEITRVADDSPAAKAGVKNSSEGWAGARPETARDAICR